MKRMIAGLFIVWGVLLTATGSAAGTGPITLRAEPIVSFTQLHTTRGVWVRVTAQDSHSIQVNIVLPGTLRFSSVQTTNATCDAGAAHCTATIDADHAAEILVLAAQQQACIPILTPVYATEGGQLAGRDLAVYDPNFFDTSCGHLPTQWLPMIVRP